MKHITVNTYRKDKYYPRVMRAFAKILSKSDVVATVNVLIEMGNLSKKNHDAWRQGKVPFLERSFEGNLSKANRILRVIGFMLMISIWCRKLLITTSGVKVKNELCSFRNQGMKN